MQPVGTVGNSLSTKRVFVTGGTGFLGYRVVRALLEQGAQVTALVNAESVEKLGTLQSKVQCVEGDPWNPASLRGRGRGHSVVVHLVGGLKPDPTRGASFRHLNYVSARNVAQMAVSDGVPHMLLLSASTAPLGVANGYIESKRDAEQYVQSTGLTWTIVRTPALYVPGERRNIIYRCIALFGAIPLFGLLVSAQNPIPVDTAARGIASLALSADALQNRMIMPRQLRKLGRSHERWTIAESSEPVEAEIDIAEEPPFGWLPPQR
jgi:uncharacterized protein YbjT (DUF2867 family)